MQWHLLIAGTALLTATAGCTAVDLSDTAALAAANRPAHLGADVARLNPDRPPNRALLENSESKPAASGIQLASHDLTAGSSLLQSPTVPKTEIQAERRDRKSDGLRPGESGDQQSENSEPAPPPEVEDDKYGPDGQSLSLEAVTESIVRAYPLLQAVAQQRWIAYGNVLEASGEFDTKLKAGALEAPLGFYDNYQHYVGLDHPLYCGADVFTNYHIGRGYFEPWFKERETDHGGEFKMGINLPLLQGRRIDERRADLGTAHLAHAAAEPAIQTELIGYLLAGALAYWDWVAAGRLLEVSEDLLQLAIERQEAIQARVDEGDLPEIALADNRRLIASRRAKLITAQQKFSIAAVKLSLFLRRPDGAPVIPGASALPKKFPEVRQVDTAQWTDAAETAWANRPELASLALERQGLQVELAQAANMALPDLDWNTVVSKDVGEPKLDKGKPNKHPLELDTHLVFSVPLQRRKAIGKQTSVEAKIAQVNAKERFTRDKILTEVQAALVAMAAVYDLIEQTETNLELARELETAEEERFTEGESDLILVNIREQATADARAEVIGAYLAYFQAESQLRAALGILPQHGAVHHPPHRANGP